MWPPTPATRNGSRTITEIGCDGYGAEPHDQRGEKLTSYGRKFLIFQLSKYVWGLAVLFLIGTLVACVRGPPIYVAGACLANVALAYLAFRMTNQYRCPNCNRILVFAHGTSSGDGSSTFCTTCPFCGTHLT
jgi:hypothetical protein